MSRPKLLPEIGTGLGFRKKSDPDLGFRDQGTPKEKPVIKDITREKKEKSVPVNKVLKIRNEVLERVKKGGFSDVDIKAKLDSSGVKDPLALEAILSNELNDNVILYFLQETKNNPKKAKALAKKFGFEV